ncbi:hypothetical protein HHK36_028999 [Tetracentron sinense]|uniref:Uncharacterized protein n=1 Tax=Tetracentron sinense TaxID=13715 RepID=A0A834YEB5_TETSI|nr:hypothetical protein HHK36_028999 [Tetracentron sinense]
MHLEQSQIQPQIINWHKLNIISCTNYLESVTGSVISTKLLTWSLVASIISSLDITIDPLRRVSELTVRRPGKVPEGAIPSSSPGWHAVTCSCCGSNSSSPPTTDGFGTGTPMPNP